MTVSTPGIRHAGEGSTRTMRACGWGDRSVAPHSMPSAHRSDEKAKRPWTLATPSGRGGLSPSRPGRAGASVAGPTRVSATLASPGGALGDDGVDGGEDPAVAGAAAEVP